MPRIIIEYADYGSNTFILRTDLNGDGTVNIVDVSIVAKAFSTKDGDPTYKAIADLNCDGTINILDISKVARDFGKTLDP